MKQEMEPEKIHQALEKVCSSAIFEKSPQNIKILKFLVDQALKKEFVKEFTLGVAIFGEEYSPEESTSKVRVAMYKFRKKLEQYYLEEGKSDGIIFIVKKGQYNLEFRDRHSLKKKTSKKNKPIVITAIIGLIGLATILLLTQHRTYTFWDYFFKANSNTLCFVSDRFVISKITDEGAHQFITDNKINTEDDFREFQKRKNDTSITIANSTYTSKMAPIAINDLASWFTENNSRMTVRLESEFQFNDISNHNLIIIGRFRNFKNAKEIFLSNSQVFKTQRNGFLYYNANDSIDYRNSFENMNRIDYTMVSFMNLENNRKALFIASNNDIGVIALCKKLSNKNELKEFYSHIPNKETSFNALFKVSGIKRTEIGCELLHIELVP